MKEKCDICGTTKNVKAIVFVKGDSEVDRIYHFCYDHLLKVYANTIDDFAENNEYKVNSYLKTVADKLIVDAQCENKSKIFVDENGEIDVNLLSLFEVRNLNPYESE